MPFLPLDVSYAIISLQPDIQGPVGACHRLEAVRGSAQANLCVHPHTGNYDMIPKASFTFSRYTGIICTLKLALL